MTTLFPWRIAVAGVSWHQDVVASLRVGDPVSIVLEPENPFDAHARRIDTEFGVAGHVPRSVSARLFDDGVGELAGVVAVTLGHDVMGLRIDIFPVDQPVLEEVPVADENAVELAIEVEEPALVYVRSSGRYLGHLSADLGERVRFIDEAQATMELPAVLVEVR